MSSCEVLELRNGYCPTGHWRSATTQSAMPNQPALISTNVPSASNVQPASTNQHQCQISRHQCPISWHQPALISTSISTLVSTSHDTIQHVSQHSSPFSQHTTQMTAAPSMRSASGRVMLGRGGHRDFVNGRGVADSRGRSVLCHLRCAVL